MVIANATCLDVSGTWITDTFNGQPSGDATELVLSQNGCNIKGTFNNAAIHHDVVAEPLDGAGALTITRTDLQQNHCVTLMKGTLRSSSNGTTIGLFWELTGTNGSCGLPASYHETRAFRKLN